ncbi:MAG: CcmD family protein [Lentimicrobium sp.]|nr:CcmD family protein [Lentimicrobium sp.]
MIGDDKFFVVLIVMVIIFSGLGVYLFMLDRKLTRIEKKQKEISGQKSVTE